MFFREIIKNIISKNKFHKIFFYSIYTQAAGTHIPQVFFLGGILSIYIINIGGSNFDIGLFTMLFHSSIILSYTIFPLIQKYKINVLMNYSSVSTFIFFTSFLFIVNVSPFINFNTTLIFILCSTLIYRTSDNIYGISRITYVYDNIPKYLHGRYFGNMRLIISLIVISISLLSGYILSDKPSISNFNNLIILYIFIYLFRIYFSYKLPIIHKLNTNSNLVFSKYLKPLKNIQFRNYLIHDVFVISIYTILNPFFIPFLIQDLNYPSSLAIYSFSCLQLGNIISLLKWGKIVDLLGNIKTTKYSLYIILISYILIYFLPEYGKYKYFSFIISMFVFLLLGVGLSGLNISFTVRFLDKIEKKSRINYLNIGIMISDSIRAIWPFIAGIILSKNFFFYQTNFDFNILILIIFVSIHLIFCITFFNKIFK